ncbi:hypothetical protein GGR57DRAFT_501776 [Xylariaceae sp. FL1272]|nr:hypothetical protein GGR57DRAFT_501776 [Xylariaceae sp. FL1272]
MASETLETILVEARKRAETAKQSRLETLPPELKMEIARLLRHPIHLALTGPNWYEFVTKNEAILASVIVFREVDEHSLTIAIARQSLLDSGWMIIRDSDGIPVEATATRAYYESSVPFLQQRLTRKYAKPEQLRDVISSFKLASRCLQLEIAVRYYARRLALRMVEVEPSNIQFPASPTETVMRRLKKALYIFQLLSDLCPYDDLESRGPRPEGVCKPSPNTHVEIHEEVWNHLAPWEMAQVRSLQFLLEGHMQSICVDNGNRVNVVSESDRPTDIDFNDVNARNMDWEHIFFNWPISWFLIFFAFHKGLERLYALESSQDVSVREAVLPFAKACSRTDAFWLRKVIIPILYGYPLSPDWETKPVLLNLTNVFDKFSAEERGTIEVWYHLLLQERTDNPLFRHGMDNQFQCYVCRNQAGCIFWDHINYVDPTHAMPTIEEMQNVGAGIWLDLWDLADAGDLNHYNPPMHHPLCEYG